MTDPADLTRRLKQASSALGFRRAAVCPADAPERLDLFHQWLEAGYAGQMKYLEDRKSAYSHPRHVLSGAKSLVMLMLDYTTTAPQPTEKGYGRVSRYAWGSEDYHDVVHPRLKELAGRLREWAPGCEVRGVIDTAPLLERDFAQLAGLGWIGKNTLLLDKGGGSYFFLAALLTDQILSYDEPFSADHCGQCTACLDACPTDAFPEPYVLDARRCISYLTIELRDAIPRELRSGVGDWLFGCDICQEVCPWNRHAVGSDESAFAPREEMDPCELTSLFGLDEEGIRDKFRRSPLWRSRRRGLLRNAAVVLGNQRHVEATPALIRALGDAEPLVRGAAAWALGRIGGDAAIKALEARSLIEPDAAVRDEITHAQSEIQSS